MAGIDKYFEGKYFYNQLKVQKKDDYQNITYLFSAFINAIRSVPDFILEEANEHYELGIPDESRSFRNAFQRKSCGSSSIFYNYWKELTDELESYDAIKSRNINVHRRKLPAKHGRYFIGYSYQDIEDEILELYQKYFSNNYGGWESTGRLDVEYDAYEIDSIGDAEEIDPFLEYRYISNEFQLITSVLLDSEPELADPICIICFKILILCEQYISSIQKEYPWIKGVADVV